MSGRVSQPSEPPRTVQAHVAIIKWWDDREQRFIGAAMFVEGNVLRVDPLDSWDETLYIPLGLVRHFRIGNVVTPKEVR